MHSHLKKQLIVMISAILVAVLLIVCVFSLFHKGGENFETSTQNTITYNGEKYSKKEIINLLVMGIDSNTDTQDSGFYYNDGRADFLALISVDVFAKSYTVLHLNRDTITDVQVYGVRGEYVETRKEQLALAHTYGDGLKQSCEYTKNAVSALLNGITIDYYVSLNIPAIAILNDAIGGVPVKFDKDYTTISPDFLKGSTVTLNGDEALALVRSRINVDDGTNISRMERQMLYVDALISQFVIKNREDSELLGKVFEKTADYIVTNSSVNTFNRIFGYISDYTCTANKTLDGVAEKGETYMEFYVDEESKTQLIMNWFYKKHTSHKS